jgi:hypothetical protein
MNKDGQTYFDDKDRVPPDDVERLRRAREFEEARAALAALEEECRQRLAEEFPEHEGPGFPE